MRVTFFADVMATDPKKIKERELDLAALARIVSGTEAPTKRKLPLLKLATFGDVPSPPKEDGTGGGSYRWDDNVKLVYGIECDYDGEEVPFEEAVELARDAGLAALLYTSPSYTPEKPRWRAIFPLANPVLPDRRTIYADRVNALFEGILARETWTISQSFFYGHAQDNPHFILELLEGVCLDEAETLSVRAYAPQRAASSGAGSGSEGTVSDGSTDVDPALMAPRSVEDLPPRVRRVVKSGDHGKFNFATRNHMIFYVACSCVRAGWDEDSITNLLLDKTNQLFVAHVYEQSRPPAYARKQARDAAQKQRADWVRNMFGAIHPQNQSNVKRALDEIGVKLYRDAFKNLTFVNGWGPLRELDDRQLSALRLEVERRFDFLPPKDYFFEVMEDRAYEDTRHPLQDYLDQVQKKWDGKPRLGRNPDPRPAPTVDPDHTPSENPAPTVDPDDPDQAADQAPEAPPDQGDPSWLATYGGADDNALNRELGRLTLVAAVRRARQPGAVFHEMLVFVNPRQGTNKSSAVRALAPNRDWFSDSLPLHAAEQKVIEQLGGKWIIEFPELNGMKQTEVEQLKAFLGRDRDKSRLAYGRLPVEVPRQWIAIGTTNTIDFLKDLENRRYWPVMVRVFDIEALSRDMEQLWAEAATIEATGCSIRLDARYWEQVTKLQMGFRQVDPWAEILSEVLGKMTGKLIGSDALELVGRPAHMKGQAEQHRIGNVLRELGFERRKARINGTVTWAYVRGTADWERAQRIYVYRDFTTGRVTAGHAPSGGEEYMGDLVDTTLEIEEPFPGRTYVAGDPEPGSPVDLFDPRRPPDPYPVRYPDYREQEEP